MNAFETNPKKNLANGAAGAGKDVVIDVRLKSLYYGSFKAVRDTHIPIKRKNITAFIGPSGCGKSTVLRSINRMNDLIDLRSAARTEGEFHVEIPS